MEKKAKNFLTHERYYEKRYEVTKDIVTALVNTMDLETIKSSKQRETLVYYSVQLAQDVMNGLDYALAQSTTGSNSTITNLADLMRANDESKKEDN